MVAGRYEEDSVLHHQLLVFLKMPRNGKNNRSNILKFTRQPGGQSDIV